MRPVRYHAMQSLAALALAAIPALALAQAPAQSNPAAEHLAAARGALNKVLNAPVPAGETFKKVSELKSEYILLERAASTSSPEWIVHYTNLDRLAGELIGASPSSKEAGAVGTSGRAGSAAGRLDAAGAANLQDFRTHMKAFSSAMSTVTPSVAAAPPAAAAAAASPALDGDAAALVDQVTAMIDRALNAAGAAQTVPVDRAALEQMKTQLERVKQRIKTP